MQIAGRRALVTGANRGIGRHFVDALVARGAERVYAAARTPGSLAEVVAQHGDRVVPVQLDVTDLGQINALAERLPDVALLVSNAGLGAAVPVLAPADDTLFREVFEVNFFGPLNLVRAFAPHLRTHAGGVLFVQSLTALVISRSSPVYSASKAAAMMLAAGVRAELRSDNVTVTSAFPGFVDTDMNAGIEVPKAHPRAVADRSLDAWEQGTLSAFPDRLAELVERAVVRDMAAVLSDPQAVMTGLIAELRAGASPDAVRVDRFHYPPGGHTHWHLHTGEQVLYGESGRGWVQFDGRVRDDLTPGSVVHVPVGLRHWHGAVPDQELVHLAVTAGGDTVWLGEVSEVEYRAGNAPISPDLPTPDPAG
jgi:NAD(P)-dependent dehydrogenase (short-subunit alcohol dehydrogenase family)